MSAISRVWNNGPSAAGPKDDPNLVRIIISGVCGTSPRARKGDPITNSGGG